MMGKPYGLLLASHDGDGGGVNGTQKVPDHEDHPDESTINYSDDDFFQVNNVTSAFNDLLQNYTFELHYTGQRWYGQIQKELTSASFIEEEYHAFWNNAFSAPGVDDNRTLIISAPTSRESPVGVDFFEMRRRNILFEGGIHFDYGPYGVLIPLVEHEGSGFFHCNRND